MSILSYIDLVRRVIDRQVIRGADIDQLNGSSIDVRLGPVVLYESRDPKLKDDEQAVISLAERESPVFERWNMDTDGPFLLYPGCFILAATLETFHMPADLSAEFRLKSSAGRMGLGHALAVWCDPGWTGSALTLELHNSLTNHIVQLQTGDRIGQMVFHDHYAVPPGRLYSNTGAYNHDAEPTPAKPSHKGPSK